MKKTISKLLHVVGVISIIRRIAYRNARAVLMFHGISSKRWNIPPHSQPHITSDDLDLILGWFAFRFQFLTPDAFLFSTTPGVLITFDDGFSNNVTNALPVLERYQAHAVFFISNQHVIEPTNWLPATRVMVRNGWGDETSVEEAAAIDLYNGMSVKQLSNISRHPLVTIGAHTISHPFLTSCSEKQLHTELCDARIWLQDITGQQVSLLAYPTGDYNEAVMEYTKRAGYTAAFASDANGRYGSAFEIPRIGLYESGEWYLNTKMSGLLRKPMKGAILDRNPTHTEYETGAV